MPCRFRQDESTSSPLKLVDFGMAEEVGRVERQQQCISHHALLAGIFRPAAGGGLRLASLHGTRDS